MMMDELVAPFPKVHRGAEPGSRWDRSGRTLAHHAAYKGTSSQAKGR